MKMGNEGRRIATVAIAATLALAGCTYNAAPAAPPVTGAAVGGPIGAQMASQERELRQALAGTGAAVTNTGSQLRVILPEAVTFASASSELAPPIRPALKVVSDSLEQHPSSTVRVVGHTDNVGSAAYNSELSRDRALAVARELIATGTAASRVSVSGRGGNEPITSNASAAGRAQNRRVEIVITPTN
jgi:outer membrane protein OmpA-like peptidoglycan-associated protein